MSKVPTRADLKDELLRMTVLAQALADGELKICHDAVTMEKFLAYVDDGSYGKLYLYSRGNAINLNFNIDRATVFCSLTQLAKEYYKLVYENGGYA